MHYFVCVNLYNFVCQLGSLVIITLCETSQTLSSSLAMAAAQDDVKEEVLTPQKTATARPPEPDDCVPGRSHSKVQSILEVYKQYDPDSMLKSTDFADPITHAGRSMQFILEVAAASSEDALAARLHAFFEPKSDLSYGKKGPD